MMLWYSTLTPKFFIESTMTLLLLFAAILSGFGLELDILDSFSSPSP